MKGTSDFTGYYCGKETSLDWQSVKKGQEGLPFRMLSKQTRKKPALYKGKEYSKILREKMDGFSLPLLLYNLQKQNILYILVL